MKVQSSALSDIDYDPEAQTLTVTYRNGGKYRHEGVPSEVHEEVINAPSVGKAFLAKIRTQYPATKL